MKQLILIAIATALPGAGCELKFGDDIELVAPNVTAKELAEVTQRTGIQFPVEATGLGYVFFGSGIDDSLAIKVLIPDEKKSDFLKNDLFQSGEKNKPSVQIGSNQSWWNLKELKDRVDRTKSLTKGRYVECSFGKAEGKWVAYISWMSS
ncbi:MAG: hypothetical protein QGI37_06425 [Verrucomicrobiota bacterium]|jgi:hypothetical protein|nr:hypothetical protein [Verrucomicrobiota bacterium]MDP6250638.1 hypothetical protein [Verrucomicrobiota bacterium]MDP7441374.1 hypothetical protein [Verrucomicrobiota bacterium]|tara:strand:+ start:1167 stop:1616 length:450 start_codon:yes stop_codon:yes gene_type:complete